MEEAQTFASRIVSQVTRKLHGTQSCGQEGRTRLVEVILSSLEKRKRFFKKGLPRLDTCTEAFTVRTT